jgi:hypothetical protein
MSRNNSKAGTKIVIRAQGPILPGSLSIAPKSQCGKPNCACKSNRAKWHGPYHRWTGFIAGKRTTKNISLKAAKECKRRINNYRALEQQLNKIIEDALANAPWIEAK